MYSRTFSTLGCAGFEPAEIVDLARRHQMSTVEMRAMSGSTELPVVLERLFGSPSSWAAFLRENGIQVGVFGTSFRLIDGSAADWDAMLRYVPWAEAAQVPWLRVFDGGGKGDAQELAKGAEAHGIWQEERERQGWQTDLIIETHDSLLTTPRLEAFFAAAPGARLLWDSHHTWKRGEENPSVTWESVASHTSHIHVKDSVSRPSPDGGAFTYVLPGEGEFPMVELRTALQKSGYAGGLSLEWERLWHPYMPPLEDALNAASSHKWW